MLDKTIQIINCSDNNEDIPDTLAPKTFLIPTSFILFLTINDVKPNNPKNEINNAKAVNTDNN